MQHMKHTKNKTPNTHKQKTNEHTNNKPTCLASAYKDNGKSKKEFVYGNQTITKTCVQFGMTRARVQD